jgi:uncharacterized MAPEG superfamily protein
VIFIVARLVYLAAYYYDKALLRSMIWFVGFGSSLALIGKSIA